MTAPQTNIPKHQVLAYLYHPEHLPDGPAAWPVHKWCFAKSGSYAVSGAAGTLDGTYRGYITAATHRNQMGSATQPNMVYGNVTLTLVRNSIDTPLDLEELNENYNFLIGYTAELYRVNAADPLPIKGGVNNNMFHVGTIGNGDLDLVLGDTGEPSTMYIRIPDRMKLDDAMLLRESYGDGAEISLRWRDKPKPALFGKWSDADSNFWIESPIVDITKNVMAGLGAPCPAKEYFTGQIGAYSDDITDSRRASENWVVDCHVNEPLPAGTFMNIATGEWRWKGATDPEDGAGTEDTWKKAADDIYVDPTGGGDYGGAYEKLMFRVDPDADDLWEDGARFRLKAPLGFPQFGTLADGDTATCPSDIIYLLLRDSTIGLGVLEADIDVASFAAVKALIALAGGYPARNWIKDNVKVSDVIAEICFEFCLKLVSEAGKYKLVFLAWDTVPVAGTEIQAGQCFTWTQGSDSDREARNNTYIDFMKHPTSGKYHKFRSWGGHVDMGAGNMELKLDWVYDDATVEALQDRFAALHCNIIRNLSLEMDFSGIDITLGEMVYISTPGEVNGWYQVKGYDRRLEAPNCRIDLIAISDIVT